MKRIKINGLPGTGKTTFLLGSDEHNGILKEWLEAGIPESNITVISFSKSAQVEANDRIQQLTGRESRIARTIHSICKELLHARQLFDAESALKFASEKDYEMSGASIDDDTLFYSSSGKLKGDRLLGILSYSQSTFCDLHEAIDLVNSRSSKKIGYTEMEVFCADLRDFCLKGKERIYTFTDLLVETLDAGLEWRSDYFIIDEAQDLSPLQWALIQMWTQDAEQVIIAGDPYQAIYEFQGACPLLMLDWKADLEFTLDKSYRCSSQVQACAQAIANRMSRRFDNDSFIPAYQGGEITRRQYGSPGTEWQRNKRVFYMFLENKRVEDLKRNFMYKGIPFGYIKGGKAPMQSKSAEKIRDVEKLRANRPIYFGEYYRITKDLEAKTYFERGVKAAISRRYKELKNGGEERIYLSQLRSMGWTEEGVERLRSGRTAASDLKGVNAKQRDYILRIIKNYGLEAMDRNPCLLIGTLHSAKGREADFCVICPDLPYPAQKTLEEEPDVLHRLFYTAVTRAKETIFVMDPGDSSSGKYYEIPVDNLESDDARKSGIDREYYIRRIVDDFDWNDDYEDEESDWGIQNPAFGMIKAAAQNVITPSLRSSCYFPADAIPF